MSDIFSEVYYHFTEGSREMEKRKTRKNGWDDVLRSYHGFLPTNWPYQSKITDPIIRTTLLEKTSRLFNGKLRGKVTPREGGDVIKAKMINAILSFQWDSANNGGTMIEKWVQMDINTRLYGASYGLCYWDTQYEGDKKVFEGNEFKVLDNRDVLVDFTATHIRNSNWIQVREFATIDDLEKRGGFNLEELKGKLARESSDARDIRYTSTVKQMRGMEDKVGKDRIFPVVEVVTEYRPDRWITFAPRYGEILRDIECPYKLKQIPVVQLRYYPTGDDMYGESEVESVLPIARAVNAILSGFIDTMNLATRPPVKIANNSNVRLDTIVYGPNALWLTGDSTSNVMEQAIGTQAIQAFQNAYPVLKSAFSTAMGELSQGISNIDPMGGDKTATEIRASVKQGQSRDQYNQMYLEEALKEQMMFWIANDQQFLFDDPEKHYQIFRIVGNEMMRELQALDLASMDYPDEAMNTMAEMLENGTDIAEAEMILEETKVPRKPVILNPKESDPSKYQVKPKMEMDEDGEFASLYVTPDDMVGVYDYIPSVKSMNIGVSDAESASRSQALQLLLNPSISERLKLEGSDIRVKDLLVEVLEDSGIKNASKLFKEVQNEKPITGAEQNAGGIPVFNGASSPQGMGDPSSIPTQPTQMA